MKTIYFISNNLISNINIIYNNEMSYDVIKKNKLLSQKGEELAKKIAKFDFENKIDVIYSSSYINALCTSKYLAIEKEVDIICDDRLDERSIGDLGYDDLSYLIGMQEHDFNYKLKNGESINEVKERISNCIKDILKSNYENIIVVSHNIALLSLFTNWCNKGFSLDDRLVLEYRDNVIFDGTIYPCNIIKTKFNEEKCLDIIKLK